jgi:hypothetical protein
MMTHVAKIIEIIGSSEKGWSEAAQAEHWTKQKRPLKESLDLK